MIRGLSNVNGKQINEQSRMGAMLIKEYWKPFLAEGQRGKASLEGSFA